MHKSPASGAKLRLNMTSVRSFDSQSVLFDCSIVPTTNDVFPKAWIPTTMIKPIKKRIKMTPSDPTRIKMERSFFIVISVRIGNIMKPQYDYEKAEKVEVV